MKLVRHNELNIYSCARTDRHDGEGAVRSLGLQLGPLGKLDAIIPENVMYKQQ